MFQYHGTRISLPLRPELPISGVSKPDLRASLIGNDKYGAYRTGTPLNLSFIPLAVPTPRLVSISIDSPSMSQSSESGGQVVYCTPSKVSRPFWLISIASAAPRELLLPRKILHLQNEFGRSHTQIQPTGCESAYRGPDSARRLQGALPCPGVVSRSLRARKLVIAAQ